MKFVADRPFFDLDLAARKLVELANATEAVQTGRSERTVMNDGTIETSTPSISQVGSSVTVRGKAWIVEGAEQRGPVQTLNLISCEDDSQGEVIELVSNHSLPTCARIFEVCALKCARNNRTS